MAIDGKELLDLPTATLPLSGGEWLYLVDGDGNSRRVRVTDLGASLSDKYGAAFGAEGTLEDGQEFPPHVFADTISFPTDLATSQAAAEVAATDETVLSLQKNGVEFATVTFNAAATTGSFSGSATSFNSGDILTVVGPTPADATLAGIAITLRGSR